MENAPMLTRSNADIDKLVLTSIETADPESLDQILRKYQNYKVRIDAISKTMLRPDDSGDIPYCHRIEQCFHRIMEAIPPSERIHYVNYKDILNHLPLEYCAEFEKYSSEKYNIEAIISALLNAGASFADEDSSGNSVIIKFDSEKLKGYFNECVTKSKDNIMTFNFENILPSRIKYDRDQVDVLKILLVINGSLPLKCLFHHPLIAMFLIHVSNSEWQNLRSIYYINLIFYICFYLSLLLQLMHWYRPIGNVWPFLLIMTCLLVDREMFQIIISPGKYFKTVQNYLEITIVTLIIIASIINNMNITEQLVVFAFLFSTFELLLLVGSHLHLIKYMMLFNAVFKIFLKLSIFFIVTVIAFAVSFNILFSSTSDTEPNKFFANPLTSIFITIIMATGEYEPGSINYNNHPIGSQIVLLLFVIIVSIILMNVILGLAVSDIQRIEQHSKLHGYIATIEFIHQVETVIRHSKMKEIFQALGRVHGFLDVPKKISSHIKRMKRVLIVGPDDKEYDYIFKIILKANERLVRQDILYLVQLVESIKEDNVKIRQELQLLSNSS